MLHPCYKQMKQHLNKYIGIVLFVTLQLSCNEVLPSRDDAPRAFETTLTTQYFLAQSDNSLKIYVTVKNIFDETFEDRAVLKGTLELTLVRIPEIKKTIQLTSENVITAPKYNRETGILTLDPGRSLVMSYSWDFHADSSVSLPDSIFHYYPDETCFGRKIAFQEDILIKGELAIFERATSLVISPAKFSFCYVNIWVRPGSCPPVECKSLKQ